MNQLVSKVANLLERVAVRSLPVTLSILPGVLCCSASPWPTLQPRIVLATMSVALQNLEGDIVCTDQRRETNEKAEIVH